MAEILQVNWRYAVTKTSHLVGAAGVPSDSSKSKLRGVKRKQDNEDRLGRKRGQRTKNSSPKMSKYRRKTANARERMRMGEINVAYDRLKDTIPLPAVGAGSGRQKCDKLTKINLLHIAINYIRTLQDILDTGDPCIDIVPEKLILNPFRESDKVRRESGSSVSTEEEQVEQQDMEDMDKTDSPDSGIQEDSDIECPDWTELNSTLDIRSSLTEAANNQTKSQMLQNDKSKGIPSTKKQSLPSSSTNNVNFKLHNFVPDSENKVTKCKPVTLTSRSQNVHANSKHKVTSLILKQDTNAKSDNFLHVSGLHMEQDELFNELNTSIDSLDEISDIDFCYDDPFKVF